MNKQNNIIIDVILDLALGDSGKGKVSHIFSGLKGFYTHTLRFNGSQNAGHTIFHNSEKFVTHMIPAGVFHGIPSVIGPGCAFNVDSLFKEIEELESGGIEVKSLLKIAKNSHIITKQHLLEEATEAAIGTTKRGVGPAYRDKYARLGKRADSVSELKPFLIDMYEEFYETDSEKRILAEGAQGFYLDIDWGDYPYVTSSHCGIGGVLLNGFTPKHIHKVYGVIKAYDTYVGAKQFEPKDSPDTSLFAKIRDVGQEYGATTGRPRQCNWLNLDKVVKASNMNDVSMIVVNKTDILQTVGVWKLYHKNELKEFSTEEKFKDYVQWILDKETTISKICWSSKPNEL